MTGLRVLVVGAGIAGLAFARAAGDRGMDVEVIERDQQLPTTGAGLYLPANATRALDALGVGPDIAARGNTIARQQFRDHRGRLLADVDTRAFWHGVGECLAIRRTALLDVLRAAAGDVQIRFDVTVTHIEGAAAVTLSDGTTRTFDVVVGADGVGSTVRQLAFDGGPPTPVGQVAWRYVVEDRPDLTDWVVRLGRGRAFLTIALGDGLVYCYADVSSALATGVDDWRDNFADFGAPVPDLLTHGRRAHRAVIEEVTTPRWTARGVVLIGDAAHASSPNMAQGVAMAAEDALVLADLLATRGLDDALMAFVDRRTPRVRWVQRQTHRRDRTRDLPAVLRDATLRVVGRRIYASNYTPLLTAP